MNAGFLLSDLTAIMAVAAVVMYVCHLLRQPPVLGYLAAGFIIGPYTPPFTLISDVASINSISQLGLVFIMFALGLEFNLPRLRKAGVAAAISAFIVVSGMTLSGFMLGRLAGLGNISSVFLGGLLSISGSSIIAKTFSDMKITQEPFAQAVFGLMICEDVFAMVMLSVLSGLGAGAKPVAADAALAFVRVLFFILLFLILGLLIVPKFMRAVARFTSRELTGITVLGICFASAFLAEHFKFSVALGTFLAGAILATTGQIGEIEDWIKPLKDMFSALFFVSAGMLVSPVALWEHRMAVVWVAALAVVGRTLWGAAASFLVGYEAKTALHVAASIAQIGEVSFIIAGTAVSLGFAGGWLYSVIVAVAGITSFLSPYMIRDASRLERFFTTGALGRRLMRLEKPRSPATAVSGAGRPVFSRYLLRTGVYVTLLAGLILLGGTLATALAAKGMAVVALLWLVVAAAAVPLILSVSRYTDHIFLLLFAWMLGRLSPLRLLRRINIRTIYAVANVFIIAVMAFGFMAFLAAWIGDIRIRAAVIGAAVVLGLSARGGIGAVRERMEVLLDYIVGLAASEPEHQNIVMRPDRQILLRGITEQAFIDDKSPAAGKTIRAMAVREKTGATVVAVYRAGRHIPNPVPDTELAPGDIVVLLGDKTQCETAAALLAGGA